MKFGWLSKRHYNKWFPAKLHLLRSDGSLASTKEALFTLDACMLLMGRMR